MSTIQLEGKDYVVTFRIKRGSYEDWSRGDHGMGGATYLVYYYDGNVTVRERKTEKCVAFCLTGLNSEKAWNVSEEKVLRMIIVNGVPEDKKEQYADEIARRVIEQFVSPRENWGTPKYALEAPDHQDLVTKGILLDVGGQRHLAIK